MILRTSTYTYYMVLPLCLWILVSEGFTQERRVEVRRDHWGVPHIFASNENDGFFGVGYVSAEDRLLQMELFRRRATGRLADVLGTNWAGSDRKFRTAGLQRYCLEAAAGLPEQMRGWLNSFAAGVNRYVSDHPDNAWRRLAPLNTPWEPWTEDDSICSWWAASELFDPLFDENAAQIYLDFRELAAQIGEEEALRQRGMILDDVAAVVPESEMAKDATVYAKLIATPRTPGFWFNSFPDETLKFSHAWALDGTRSVTGKPLLESDPQTPVNNPALWYEFHLSAGRFDVRGVGFAGSPAMLIGYNRKLAWGASALGVGANATFIEMPGGDGETYFFRGTKEYLRKRIETIAVKDGQPVKEQVARTRHGFVFDNVARNHADNYLQVSHNGQIEARVTSLRGLLEMMAAENWPEFRAAMEHYYSPGIHMVYADVEGNVGYQTLVHAPLTTWTRRMALEGWTGESEIQGRIPLNELPHMLNPDAHFVSHANNLPVGSWYPYDLGIGTGGTGHSARSLRLVEILRGDKQHSLDSFEAEVHRDDIHANVAKLFPIAKRQAMETNQQEGVPDLLQALSGWDLHYRGADGTYSAAMALAGNLLLPFRRSAVSAKVGGGEGGISHLARLLEEQYGTSQQTPVGADVRAYLADWLKQSATGFRQNPVVRPAQSMPYQGNGPMALGSLNPRLDLVSPLLSCTQVGTIWSQQGNSYTQIVDLADVDQSRTVLPPGVSEDPESPWYTNQVDLWVQGSTHPAPLSKAKVDEITIETLELMTGTLPLHGRTAVVNAASFTGEQVLSPGGIASIFGEDLTEETAVASGFPLPPILERTMVTVNGAAAPLFFVSPRQINFQAPYGIATSTEVKVFYEGRETAAAAVQVAGAAPGIFTIAQGASRLTAALNQDGTLNKPENPAVAGSVIQVYLTGLGEVTPALAAGIAANSSEPLNRVVAAPKVYVNGIPAQVEFAGLAPGYTGLYQVNLRLSSQLAAGEAKVQVASAYLESNEVVVHVR